MSNQSKSRQEWDEICSRVQRLVPDVVLGRNNGKGEGWIVFMASVFITSPNPTLLAQFSSYLAEHHPRYSTDSAARQRLSLRFRDVCLKLLVLIGAPKMLGSLMPLAKAEEGADVEKKAEESVLDAKWRDMDIQQIHDRGVETIHSIYDPIFLPKIFASWGSHSADIKFNELFAVYGLYLSDFQYLNPIETEAVVFACITCQGLRGPALWHMRGMGRVLGARGTDDEDSQVRKVKDMLRDMKTALMTLVQWIGDDYDKIAKMTDWVNVGDVNRELGGWGDD